MNGTRTAGMEVLLGALRVNTETPGIPRKKYAAVISDTNAAD